MTEFELKYGCNPNQKPSKIFMADGSELPIEILSGRPGYINFLDAFNSWQLVKELKEALGLEKRSVDGIFTSAIQRKQLGVRTPAEIELEDGTHKQVKFLSLTPAGMAFDPDATEEAAE